MHQKNEKNPLIPKIRDYFYNSLAMKALANNTITIDNIHQQLKYHIEQLINESLEASRNLDDQQIQISNDVIVNHLNCPWIYMNFYNEIFRISEQIKFIEMTKKIDIATYSIINQQVQNLVNTFINSNIFQDMMPELINFILEAKGLVTHDLDYKDFNPELINDLEPISPELIRDTFYNEMVNQCLNAMDNNLLSRNDLEGQESFIYFALSGLTIFEAICHSKNCSGIELLERKVVNMENCPQEEHFPMLVGAIIKCKKVMQICYGENILIPENDLTAIKQLCLCKDDEFPADLTINKKVSECATVINSLSTQISQTPMFRKMISSVIEFCLESSEQQLRF